jgi:hypothetical protein
MKAAQKSRARAEAVGSGMALIALALAKQAAVGAARMFVRHLGVGGESAGSPESAVLAG